ARAKAGRNSVLLGGDRGVWVRVEGRETGARSRASRPAPRAAAAARRDLRSRQVPAPRASGKAPAPLLSRRDSRPGDYRRKRRGNRRLGARGAGRDSGPSRHAALSPLDALPPSDGAIHGRPPRAPPRHRGSRQTAPRSFTFRKCLFGYRNIRLYSQRAGGGRTGAFGLGAGRISRLERGGDRAGQDRKSVV